MRNINEDFIQFLWKNQQLTGVTIVSTDDSNLIILDPGIQNHDAGPDFFNAKIKIDGTLWAGNIEIHINASDWIKHGHSSDPIYDTVILHIVYFNDCAITRSNGEIIPSAVIRFPTLMWDTYSKLLNNKNWIPCQERIRIIEPIYIAQWTTSLMVEKLQEKVEFMNKIKSEIGSHWDAILSRIVFRCFGIPVNTTPFEILSLIVPYSLLLRNKTRIFSLEAILFGQSGMLETVISHDKYTESLKLEFYRFAGKLQVTKVPLQSWKYMRMRPMSFPSLRIAQLAAFINKLYPLHEKLESLPGINELKIFLRLNAGDYWNNHFQLGKESKFSSKYLGESFIHQFIINGIAPYTFFFGKMTGKKIYTEYAIELLEALPAETNAISKNWGKFGIKCTSAFESQALLYLYNRYCKYKRCLECQFGNNLLTDVQIKKE